MDDVAADANLPEPPGASGGPDPRLAAPTRSAGPDPLRAAGGPDDPADAAAMARYSDALADGLVAALRGWIERDVVAVLVAARGVATDAERQAAAGAGARAVAEVGPELRRLLSTDIDAQTTTPLEIMRGAVGYPTEVLRSLGVAPVVRDAFAEHQFPDDDYDLVPRSYADIDPTLHEPGLTWGAAKAHIHLQRRRREGRR